MDRRYQSAIQTGQKVAFVSYAVKELWYTLQGEGARSGRAAVFCRFTGCNLWSGREEERATAACRFCDTDFIGTDGPGGGRYADARTLATAMAKLWPQGVKSAPYAVLTGGEPLLQVDHALLDALHRRGFEIATETNGTRTPPPGFDWICVSPKGGTDLVLTQGDELKLIFPQREAPPSLYEGLRFKHFFLQPMDGPDLLDNTRAAVAHCLAHPRWRLSLQTHKLAGFR